MKDIHLQLPPNPENRPGWVVVVNDSPPYDINVYVVSCKECETVKQKLDTETEESIRLKQSLERLRREVTVQNIKDKKAQAELEESKEGKEADDEEEEKIDVKKLLKKTCKLSNTVSNLKCVVRSPEGKEFKAMQKGVDQAVQDVETLVKYAGRLESRLKKAVADIVEGQNMMRDMRAEITDLQCEITDLKNSNQELTKGFKREKREALASLEETKNRHAAALYKQLKELQIQVREKDRQQAAARDRLRLQLEKSSLFLKKDREALLAKSQESLLVSALSAAESHISDLHAKLTSKVQNRTQESFIKNIERKTASEKLVEVVGWSLNDKKVQLRSFTSGVPNEPELWIKAVPPRPKGYGQTLQTGITEQALCIENMWHAVSSTSYPTERNLVDTLTRFVSRNPKIVNKACEAAKLPTNGYQLTKRQVADLKMILNLKTGQLRGLIEHLKSNNIQIMSPLKSNVYATICDVDTSPKVLEISREMLSQTKKGRELTKVSYLKIRDIKKEITNMAQCLLNKKKLRLDGHCQASIWLQISASCDGQGTSLSAKIINADHKLEERLLGFFNSALTYRNVETLFHPTLSKQIDELQSNPLKLRCKSDSQSVSRYVLPVKVFCRGEYEFLCDAIGHDGRLNPHPCVWCLLPSATLQSGEDSVHTPFLQSDSQPPSWTPYGPCTYQSRPQTVIRARTYGIERESLFQVPCVQRVPPVDQLLTSLVNHIFQSLVTACRTIDEGSDNNDKEGDAETAKQLKNLEAEKRKIQKEISEMELKLESAQHDFYVASEALKAMRISQKFVNANGEKKGACGFFVCIEEMVDLNRIQCNSCMKYFHKLCVSMVHSQVELNKVPYQCPACCNLVGCAPGLWERLTRKIESLQSVRNTVSGKLQKLTDTSTKFRVSAMGEAEQQLLKVCLEKFKVNVTSPQDIQLNHTQVTSLLLHVDNFVKVLKKNEKDAALFKDVLQRLYTIHKYTNLRKFLTASQVQALCHACWDLGCWLPPRFPSAVTLDFHIVVFHVPEFVRKWHTIGLFNSNRLEFTSWQFQQEVGLIEGLGLQDSFKIGYGRNVVRSLALPKELKSGRKRASSQAKDGPAAKKPTVKPTSQPVTRSKSAK
ncbi:uncharacterized protein [Ptychodera flava]|uniref:uncharacterized protein n=1 Tax=Ptychodera flava TaxID=63121 RepID=UPI00396A8DB5